MDGIFPSLLHEGWEVIIPYLINNSCACLAGTYCIFWNTFTILTFLYNIEFYPQHVLQFNYNICIYTLVILPIFKISV
jgi:hypothetical protein